MTAFFIAKGVIKTTIPKPITDSFNCYLSRQDFEEVDLFNPHLFVVLNGSEKSQRSIELPQ